MLTGLRVVDTNRPAGKHNLVDWASPSLPDKRKLKKIMDPKLEHQYPLKAAFEMASLVLKCLQTDPKNRPSINEVLDTLQHVNTIKMTPKESKANNGEESTERPSTPVRTSHHNHHHRSPAQQKQNRNNAGAGAGPRGDRTLPAKPSW